MKFGKTEVSRRQFLRGGAAGVATATLASKGVGEPPKKVRQPNILWIMSDEHNYRISSYYGNRVVQTPNVQKLADNGIVFDTHYCNSPLCVPSRASLTAGKYASRVNVWTNSSELPSADIPSLPRVLNAAGYQSYLCGKQHYDYTRRYGFIEWGGNFNNNYKTGLGHRPSPEILTQAKLSRRFEDFHPGEKSIILHHDQHVTAGAVDFFKQRKAEEQPFFLYVGYLAPHFPIIVPQEYYDRYKGKVDMPEIPKGFFDTQSLNYKVQRASFQELNVPADVVQRGRELYYGLTNWADDQIGTVLAAMKARPEIAENTIIVYSSDHGENMGEHGMWWKNNMYETATHVPLVISFPKRWKGGQRRVGASAHVDLVQTLVELGGGKAPADWNGTSMVSWMDDARHKWKDLALSEYYAGNTASGFQMIRMGEWKYVYHNVIDAAHPDQRELYHLTTDPKELNNVAAQPEHQARVAAMHAALQKEVGTDPNDTEKRCREQIAVGYHRTDPRPANADQAEA